MRVMIGVQLVIAGFQLPAKYQLAKWKEMALCKYSKESVTSLVAFYLKLSIKRPSTDYDKYVVTHDALHARHDP